MRVIRTGQYVMLGLVVGGLATGRAFAEADMQAEAERVVSQYKTRMEAPPRRVPSRDTVDGPLLGNGDLGAVIGGPPEAQRFWISKNNFWRLKDGHRQGGPRLFGSLNISIPALAGATYLSEQDIYPAITTSTFTGDKMTVTMRSFIAATADFLIIELSVAGAVVDVEAKVWAAPGRGSEQQAGQKDAMPWVTKAFSADVTIPTSAACAVKVLGADGPAFKLQPGKKVTVAMAMQSSFDAKDPLAAAQKMAEEVNAETIGKLLVAHRKWWADFWAESLVEIGDPFLEARYYTANYTLAGALRDPDFPTGLFGLWVTSDDPRWAGDYHLNFDYQSQFYGLYKSNHLTQANTFHAPILAFMDRGKWYAKNILNVRGVYYCVGIGAKGIDTCKRGDRTNGAYQRGGCFMGQKCNAAYSVIPMSMHWYHTYDTEYAKTVYPFVLEVANFWEDYLKFEDGRYVIHDDAIHENIHTGAKGDFNSLLSLGLVRSMFETAIDMSTALGIDGDRHEKWRHILKHLSTFATQERGGKTVFRYCERGTAWWNSNSLGIQHIYPPGAIGLDSDPKLLEISRNTVTALGRWSGDNGENSLYPAAVRVGYDPETILGKLTMLWSTSRKWPNQLADTTEQCSTVPNTINEMLCMSHKQVLRVFPVWPRKRDARFLNLRAEGAFLVSSELKGGNVQFVRIHSEKGRDCTIVNPWPGKAVVVSRDGNKVQTLKGDRFVLKTKAGDTVVLRRDG